jgi:hypothetical protein
MTLQFQAWRDWREVAGLELAADKPKGVDWSWPGRIMPAKSE